jgi:hypothetical protein
MIANTNSDSDSSAQLIAIDAHTRASVEPQNTRPQVGGGEFSPSSAAYPFTATANDEAPRCGGAGAAAKGMAMGMATEASS